MVADTSLPSATILSSVYAAGSRVAVPGGTTAEGIRPSKKVPPAQPLSATTATSDHRRHAVGQVRGVLAASQVIISTPLDPFLSLRALASYSGLGVRKLRDYLADPAHPLPCYRVGGKIVVRRSEFDTWIAAYHQNGRADVGRIVSDVLRDLQGA